VSIGNDPIDLVTPVLDAVEQQAGNPQQSLSCLPDVQNLMRVRVQPAQFARAMGVSKQSVSRWVKDGWVCLGADGRLDPVIAIGQLLRRCDPGRLRARWLRQAVGEVQELRDNLARAEDRAEAVEAALQEATRTIAQLERWAADDVAHAKTFRALLIERADELRAAPPEAWAQTLSDLSDAAWDIVDPESAPYALDSAMRAIHETEGGRDAQPGPVDGWLAEMELDPATAAELAALDAQLAADQ
jgi:hypothetical protein